ncbi:MAG: T9SS type A sorting domain-containing protein [Bacteroidia bacterium]|nr:T9SS type A sorting domain-containing protein [Bacteroidia bacterium]
MSFRRWLFIQVLMTVLLPTALVAQWQQTSGPGGGSITTMAVVESEEAGTTVLIGNAIQIYSSKDYGVHWDLSHPGYPNHMVRHVCANGVMVFAWMSTNFWRSTNGGDDWQEMAGSLEYGTVYATAFSHYDNGYIYLGTHEKGVYRSSDNGVHWEAVNEGLEDLHLSTIATAPDTSRYVFAGTTEGIYHSTNEGDAWTRLDGLQCTSRYPSITLIPDPAAVGNARVYVGDIGVLHVSTDLGFTWSPVNVGSTLNILRSVIRSSRTGRDTLMLNSSEGVFRSVDDGASWHLASNGIQNPDVTHIVSSKQRVFAVTAVGCYASTDNGSSWTESSSGMYNVWSNTRAMTVLPAQDGVPELLLTASIDIGVSRTTDYGDTWHHSNFGYTTKDALALYSSVIATPPHPLLLFAGSADRGVFRSEDSGLSWQNTSAGMGHRPVLTMLLKPRNDKLGEYLFAGLYGEVAFVSPNYGDNWRDLGASAPVRHTNAFAYIGDTLYAGGAFDFLWSIDDGESWTKASPPGNYPVLSLAVTNIQGRSYIFAGTGRGGVGVTTDGGTTWRSSNVGLTDKDVYAVLIRELDGRVQVFAATQRKGVFVSHDLGETWNSISEGLAAEAVESLAIAGPYLFAGTRSSGVWRRPLSDITAVEADATATSSDPSLLQTYPNPVHTQTAVQFHIPVRAFVSLTIHNIVGEKVATLVRSSLDPGTHVTRWNATGLPNGLYFCRLMVNNTVLTRKLTLMK